MLSGEKHRSSPGQMVLAACPASCGSLRWYHILVDNEWKMLASMQENARLPGEIKQPPPLDSHETNKIKQEGDWKHSKITQNGSVGSIHYAEEVSGLPKTSFMVVKLFCSRLYFVLDFLFQNSSMFFETIWFGSPKL